MSDKIRPQMFPDPLALDLLQEFVRKYRPDLPDTRETQYFERELHRTIQAFVGEALKPCVDTFSNMMLWDSRTFVLGRKV